MARRDARYALKRDLQGLTGDHGGLTGLNDDDHPQYHTDARGDSRYYTQAVIDGRVLNDLADVNVGTPGAGEDGKGVTWDNATSRFVLTDVGVSNPVTLTFAYSGGNVSDITGTGVDLDFTYNGDGTVNTIVDNTDSVTRTFAYNGDGTVSTITVT